MKDPAFLFYSKDFYEGTRMMLPEERACYIDLLIYQHQNGIIPNDLKRVAMYCSGINEATLQATLQAKFKQTDAGWVNLKLEKVQTERKEFSEKQSVNGAVGQFWKKAKAILHIKEYLNLKEVLANQSNNELLETIKDKTINKAMLQAMLKHLANANVDGIVIINNKERSEFLNFRKSELEQLRNDIFEKLKKYGLTEPIIYTSKKVPIEYYDLVEFVIECIDNEDWKLNLKTRFGNTKFELAMKDFINKIKTDMEYLSYENTSDFQRHFSNWLNKNYDKYGK